MGYLDKLREYETKGLLSLRPHPVYDLYVVNYTKTAQYSQAWDYITISNRGRVVNSNGDTISPCLPKFFNYQEHLVHDWLDPLPLDEEFVAFEKLDGSYISVTNHPDYPELIVASRGSFESEQAMWAREMIKERNLYVPAGHTYIFELIHPENRIVVDYGQIRDLVLLTRFRGEEEVGIPDSHPEFTLPTIYSGANSLDDLLEQEEDNFEGYVIQFESGIRTKVKLDEYVRLHRIVTGLTPKKVFEAVREDTIDEVIEILPDEYFDWVKDLREKIVTRFRLTQIFGAQLADEAREKYETRKDQAQFILSHERKALAPVAFKALDGKDTSEAAWKFTEKDFQTWNLEDIKVVEDE